MQIMESITSIDFQICHAVWIHSYVDRCLKNRYSVLQSLNLYQITAMKYIANRSFWKTVVMIKAVFVKNTDGKYVH